MEDVCLLDESFWMYHEDLDLGWRLWRAGWKSVLAPASVVYHKYEFSRSIQKMYYMDRNRLLVILQNYHSLTLFLLSGLIILNEIATFFLAVRGGWRREKVAVWRYFLRPSSWRLLLEKRRLRQGNRVVADRQIIKRFTARIDFQEVRDPIVMMANPFLQIIWAMLKKIIVW